MTECLVLLLSCVMTTATSAIDPSPVEANPVGIPGAPARDVVVILSSDHRYDAMSFPGHQFARTPVRWGQPWVEQW